MSTSAMAVMISLEPNRRVPAGQLPAAPDLSINHRDHERKRAGTRTGEAVGKFRFLVYVR
jgi:hypothetical protein